MIEICKEDLIWKWFPGWDEAILENTQQISPGQMVPELWLVLFEKLVIPKLKVVV